MRFKYVSLPGGGHIAIRKHDHPVALSFQRSFGHNCYQTHSVSHACEVQLTEAVRV